MRNSSSNAEHIAALLFNRNGYTRVPNEIRLKTKDRQKYKKGYEIRFPVQDNDELHMIQKALETLKIKYGAPFRKHNYTVQPVYGKDSYLRIIELAKSIDTSQSLKPTAHKTSLSQQRSAVRRRIRAHPETESEPEKPPSSQ